MPSTGEVQNTSQLQMEGGLPAENIALNGILHAYVAFDWGDEVFLDQARQLRPTESQELLRCATHPASIAYRPPPLRYPLAVPPLNLPELDGTAGTAEAKVFDFAAASVAVHLPFALSAANLVRLAAALSEPAGLIQAVRAAVEPLYSTLSPAIDRPLFSELSEEYFVFQLAPGWPLPEPAALVSRHVDWLAAIARLEADPLSAEEALAAVHGRISYSPNDLLVADWSAAVSGRP